MEKEILNEIRSDIKEIKKDINEIKILDASQNASLDAHMARTLLNEKRIEKLEDYKWLVGLVTAIFTVLGTLILIYLKG